MPLSARGSVDTRLYPKGGMNSTSQSLMTQSFIEIMTSAKVSAVLFALSALQTALWSHDIKDPDTIAFLARKMWILAPLLAYVLESLDGKRLVLSVSQPSKSTMLPFRSGFVEAPRLPLLTFIALNAFPGKRLFGLSEFSIQLIILCPERSQKSHFAFVPLFPLFVKRDATANA